jgi:hypothetical protein
MTKSVSIANQSQLGRLKLQGLIAIQMLTAVIIILAAVWAFSLYRSKIHAEVEQDLLAIAELKNQQITVFLKERISDAEVLVQRAGIWMLVDPEVQRITQGLSMSEPIAEITMQLKNAYGYGNIVVFDASERPIYPRHADRRYSAAVFQSLAKAKQTGQPQIADLHFHDEDTVHFGVIHPIRASGALAGPVVGLLFLEIPAHPNLYALVSSWPTVPSKSGESLMVRRDKDQITYLSPLRHDREMRPLHMQRPFENETLLAAKASRGELGVVRGGKDYRGVNVLGAATSITGTDWIVLTKVD